MKVSVTSSPGIRVAVNNQRGSVVRTIGVGGGQVVSLSGLTDVDASDPDENETLVYDEVLGMFVVKTLPAVDGGAF